MTQFQFELGFPTAELTFWWPGISWKTSSLAVTWGAPLWKRKNCFLNTFTEIFLTKNNQLFLWTFPWLVAVMSVDREARAWFGELSWHLKVPWNLISAKRFRIHTVAMQIKGGTAAVGVFCFDDNEAMTQFQFELKFPTAESTFCWPEISWKPSSLAVTWGGPSEENKVFLDCCLQTVFFCLVIYQPVHWKWICMNIWKSDTHGWADCLHI